MTLSNQTTSYICKCIRFEDGNPAHAITDCHHPASLVRLRSQVVSNGPCDTKNGGPQDGSFLSYPHTYDNNILIPEFDEEDYPTVMEEGVIWQLFWWYNSTGGWPTYEDDTLGSNHSSSGSAVAKW